MSYSALPWTDWVQGWYFAYIGQTADVNHLYARNISYQSQGWVVTFFNDDGTKTTKSVSVDGQSIATIEVDRSYKYWTTGNGGALNLEFKTD